MVVTSSLMGYQLIANKVRLQQKKFQREVQLVKSMLSINVIFLICYSPFSFFIITSDVLLLNDLLPYYMLIISDLINFLVFFYSSCGLFIYLLFNRQVRNYFFSMIGIQKDEEELSNQST